MAVAMLHCRLATGQLWPSMLFSHWPWPTHLALQLKDGIKKRQGAFAGPTTDYEEFDESKSFNGDYCDFCHCRCRHCPVCGKSRQLLHNDDDEGHASQYRLWLSDSVASRLQANGFGS